MVLGATMLVAPSAARAELSGEVELGYVSYDGEQRDSAGTVTDRLKGTSFRQRYSLLYSTRGAVADGRFARYNLAVGYEWGSFDTKIRQVSESTNLSASSGHVLYRGEIIVDPAELPIRIKAYSHDLNRTAFVDTTLNSNFDFMTYPDLTTELRDGTRISSGATVTLGVKNGLTNGYNALFRNLPMLMVDYRDELIRDLKSAIPQDTRLQRLAFISLNKRDNWVHYRSTKYEDHINTDQSFSETQVQIGTIDQVLQRRWVNLTNWIKISADAQFTKHNARKPGDNFEEYDVNLFGIASRSRWEARTFANYNRYQQQGSINVSRTIPVYAAGTWGGETDWNARALNREKINDQGTAKEQTISNDSVSMRFLTFKRSDFTLSPSLTVEYSNDTDVGKNIAVDAGVETRSTKRFSRDYDLFSSYHARFFRSNGVRSDGSGNYLVQDVNFSAAYSPVPQTRLTASQTFSLATGKNPQSVNNTTVLVSPVSVLNSSNPLGATSGEYMRSLTTVSGSWMPNSRLRVALTALEDILSADGQSVNSYTTLTNTVAYTAPTYAASLDTSLYVNNGPIGGSTYSIDFYGTASHRPNRNMDAALNARLNFSHDNSTDNRYLDLQQRFNYYIFKFNGVVRRLVELSEELTYTDTTITANSSSTVFGAKRLTLGAKYFPTARLYVAGFARYSLVDPGSLTQMLYSASAGVTYRQLQANVEYSFGNQYGTLKRSEKKFVANLKKYF